VELEHLHAELKKNEEEESAFAASARSITKQELFPDKTVKQLNAKLLQLKKRKLMAMQKEDENVETFVENYNELRYNKNKNKNENIFISSCYRFTVTSILYFTSNFIGE
jgi:hypothetical protein